MTVRRSSIPVPGIGPIASRLLTVPVMLMALVVCYVLLRWSAAVDEPSLRATAAADPADPAPALGDAETLAPATPAHPQARDPAIAAPARCPDCRGELVCPGEGSAFMPGRCR